MRTDKQTKKGSQMKDQNINIQVWTTVEGKFGEEQKFVGEISVKDIAEYNNMDASEVEQSDLTDEIVDILDHHERNNEEVA